MIVLNQSSTVAPFEQIKQQIASQRETGQLPAGHHLPPVRKLAQELGLAPNTVARAYKELEGAGVIETRGRQGSFVTGTAESAERVVAHAAGEFAVVVEKLGFSRTRAMELVREQLNG